MTNFLAPMTPADCDLRDFPGIMIDIGRLFGSGFNAMASANPLAWMVGHKLWYRSWHQLPAGSLPNNDAELCHLAEMGANKRKFCQVKGLAMRGWVLCEDGRLYHPVVAEVVLVAWIGKLDQRRRSMKGVSSRYGTAVNEVEIDAKLAEAVEHLQRVSPNPKAINRLNRRHSRQDVPAGAAAAGAAK